MTRLLKSFGLLIAFSLLTFNVNADIYDGLSYQAPKVSSDYTVYLQYNSQKKILSSDPLSGALILCKQVHSTPDKTNHFIASSTSNSAVCEFTWTVVGANPPTRQLSESIKWTLNPPSNSCPPDSNPTYTHERDTNNDGKTDQCYNPNDLKTASNCLAAPNILPNSTNSSGQVCVLQPNGGQCAYLAGSNGSMTKDSSLGCFTDDIPPIPSPEPPTPEQDQCLPFGSGYVCAADPAKVCTANVCPDNCGWQSLGGGANSFAQGGGQFVCFTNEPALPDKETNPNGNTDPDDPDNVTPEDETNALSKDITKVTNRLGELISLTRDKGNDMIYAINKQTGDLLGSARESNTLGTQTNSLLSEISSKLNTPTELPDNGSGDIVAAVDRNTGEVISVMREGQVKLAELGSNIILTKDIQQGVLTATQESKEEITRGFDNIIQFMQAAEEPDPETGESPMDKLLRTNSDGFAEVQRLLDELMTKPGIESAGGGSSLPTDPETGDEIVPDATDFRFDPATVQIAPDSTAIDQKIEDSKLSFLNKIREIQDLFSSKFTSGISGAGSLPSLGVIDYSTVHVDVNLSPYADQLNMIGLALIFMATLTGLFIIFR